MLLAFETFISIQRQLVGRVSMVSAVLPLLCCDLLCGAVEMNLFSTEIWLSDCIFSKHPFCNVKFPTSHQAFRPARFTIVEFALNMTM
jgi:hypothetical protein